MCYHFIIKLNYFFLKQAQISYSILVEISLLGYTIFIKNFRSHRFLTYLSVTAIHKINNIPMQLQFILHAVIFQRQPTSTKSTRHDGLPESDSRLSAAPFTAVGVVI